MKIKEKKQVKEIKKHRKKLLNSNKNVGSKSHKIFDELSYKRTSEIKDFSRKISFNNFYYFKEKTSVQ